MKSPSIEYNPNLNIFENVFVIVKHCVMNDIHLNSVIFFREYPALMILTQLL